MKPKYGEKTNSCYMDIDSFILLHKNRSYLHRHCKGYWTRFDTSNHALERSLPKGKKYKSNWNNERWITHEKNEKVCCIEISLFNR